MNHMLSCLWVRIWTEVPEVTRSGRLVPYCDANSGRRIPNKWSQTFSLFVRVRA